MRGRMAERFKRRPQMSEPLTIVVPIVPAGDRRRGPIQPPRSLQGVFAGWGPKL